MLNNRYDKIGKIIKSLKIDRDYIKNIIFLLSNYIVKSNDDYLYNSTYLTSYLDEFINFLNIFLEKQKKLELLKIDIEKNAKFFNFDIKIDLTWQIIDGKLRIINLNINRIIEKGLYLEIEEKATNKVHYCYFEDVSDVNISNIICKIDKLIK